MISNTHETRRCAAGVRLRPALRTTPKTLNALGLATAMNFRSEPLCERDRRGSTVTPSRAFILRAYPLQTHEMLFDAHIHGFRVLGGVPQRGIYDNMKTAVDRVGVGKARQVGVQAVEHHRKKVRFYSTVELVNALEQEKAQGKAGQIAERLVRCDLIILDA